MTRYKYLYLTKAGGYAKVEVVILIGKYFVRSRTHFFYQFSR